LIMADPNQGWGTAQDTIELMHRRFPTTPNLAIEQPVMYHDIVGLEQITRAIPQKVIADEALQHLPSIIDIVSRRVADMTSFKLGKCGGFYKAMQMVRISEAANVPVRIDWTQGSHLLDTATGHLHACVRLAACDPGMDYQLRIKDKPVAEGGVKVENNQFVMPDQPGLGLTVDEDVIKHLSQRK
ncbi:MAG: enolase C-terminal domain-like protein, partial [Rhodospirillales bacterium]